MATYPVDKINDIFKKIIPPENNLNPEFNSINVDLVSRNGTEVYSNYDIKSILQTKTRNSKFNFKKQKSK